jgi:hypothetical protein
MRRSLIAAATLALSCYGGGTSALPPDAGQSSSCKVDVLGDAAASRWYIVGTADCKPATTSWSSSNDRGEFRFWTEWAGEPPTVGVTIRWSGEPHTGTYSNADRGAEGSISASPGRHYQPGTWTVEVGGNSAAQGSYTLRFTSVSNGYSVSGGKVYSTEGTLDALLLPAPGGSTTGTVALHATF